MSDEGAVMSDGGWRQLAAVIRVPSRDKSGHDPMDESNFAPHGGFVDGNVRVRL
jgi:hypothetical protein